MVEISRAIRWYQQRVISSVTQSDTDYLVNPQIKKRVRAIYLCRLKNHEASLSIAQLNRPMQEIEYQGHNHNTQTQRKVKMQHIKGF